MDILNLLKEGDYVNGERVNEITKNYIAIGMIAYGRKNLKYIKSIVTKEQFEKISYKIGE